MDHLTALVRPFQLARSAGVRAVVQDIRKVLRRERYDARQLRGRRLTSQLRKMINDASRSNAPIVV
jgi:hypothetical protein